MRLLVLLLGIRCVLASEGSAARTAAESSGTSERMATEGTNPSSTFSSGDTESKPLVPKTGGLRQETSGPKVSAEAALLKEALGQGEAATSQAPVRLQSKPPMVSKAKQPIIGTSFGNRKLPKQSRPIVSNPSEGPPPEATTRARRNSDPSGVRDRDDGILSQVAMMESQILELKKELQRAQDPLTSSAGKQPVEAPRASTTPLRNIGRQAPFRSPLPTARGAQAKGAAGPPLFKSGAFPAAGFVRSSGSPKGFANSAGPPKGFASSSGSPKARADTTQGDSAAEQGRGSSGARIRRPVQVPPIPFQAEVFNQPLSSVTHQPVTDRNNNMFVVSHVTQQTARGPTTTRYVTAENANMPSVRTSGVATGGSRASNRSTQFTSSKGLTLYTTEEMPFPHMYQFPSAPSPSHPASNGLQSVEEVAGEEGRPRRSAFRQLISLGGLRKDGEQGKGALSAETERATRASEQRNPTGKALQPDAPKGSQAMKRSNRSADKPGDKPDEKPIGKLIEKPADKPVDGGFGSNSSAEGPPPSMVLPMGLHKKDVRVSKNLPKRVDAVRALDKKGLHGAAEGEEDGDGGDDVVVDVGEAASGDEHSDEEGMTSEESIPPSSESQGELTGLNLACVDPDVTIFRTEDDEDDSFEDDHPCIRLQAFLRWLEYETVINMTTSTGTFLMMIIKIAGQLGAFR